MKLKHSQRRAIENYFSEQPGYVLDFSNSTFREFFEDHLDIDIYQEKYAFKGESKLRRLFAFLEICEPKDGIRILNELWKEKNSDRDSQLSWEATFSDYSMDFEKIDIEQRVRAKEDQEFEEFLATFENKAALFPQVDNLEQINNDELIEHMEKIRSKISSGDYSGAITNSYALTEGLLKLILDGLNVEYNRNEGHIVKLYNELKSELNLDASAETLDENLRAVLSGFSKIISGIEKAANKSGDRHTKTYKPSKRHANLVANSTLTICQFLIESYEYK